MINLLENTAFNSSMNQVHILAQLCTPLIHSIFTCHRSAVISAIQTEKQQRDLVKHQQGNHFAKC